MRFSGTVNNMVDENQNYTEASAHKHFGIRYNNLVWKLLDKPDRTQADDDTMIHMAHTSHLHWKEVGQPENWVRGHWMISHVYTVLNEPKQAMKYAQSAFSLCQEHQIGDFDLAYVYEALARAAACHHDNALFLKYWTLANIEGEKIIDPEDKKLFTADFGKSPWFGHTKKELQ